MRHGPVLWMAILAVAFTVACAPKRPVSAPAAVAPKFPEYRMPAIPPEQAGTREAMALERGWTLLQSGDLKAADREFGGALKTSPAFYPAEAAFGYLELARKDARAALAHFDRAVDVS